MVSGWSGSGKTTVARILSQGGYGTVSVSECLRNDLCEAAPDSLTRRDLQNHGATVLKERGSIWLARELLLKAMKYPKACIDGIRPRGVVAAVRAMSQQCLVLFLDADFSTRAKRKQMTEDEYIEAMSHQIEHEVEAVRDMADVVISTEQGLDKLREQLCSILPSR